MIWRSARAETNPTARSASPYFICVSGLNRKIYRFCAGSSVGRTGAALNTKAASTPFGFWRTASTSPKGTASTPGTVKPWSTWEQASARILELLEAGTYLSASELAQAPDKVLHEAMDALLMTARDLNEEGRAQGLFPQTLAIHDQHKGYPELDEDMVAFAKTEGGLQTLAQEYHAFLDAYA